MLQKFLGLHLDGPGDSATFKVRGPAYGDPVSVEIMERGPSFDVIATTLYFDEVDTAEAMLNALSLARDYLVERKKFEKGHNEPS